MKILITGVSGFVGYYLSKELVSQGCSVCGIDSREPFFQDLIAEKKILFEKCDITDDNAIKQIIIDYRPDWIFHLAAVSSVSKSWQDKKSTYLVNIFGAYNILESCLSLEKSPKVLLVGSAEEYGKVKTKKAITEEMPLNGFTPYAISKITQEYLGIHYVITHGLRVYRTRSFNHTGPGQSEAFVCSSFCKQVAEIELLNKEPVIYVGNLSSYRDFLDVRDVVNAYIIIMKKGSYLKPYNVCSMKSYSIKQILNIILSYSNKKIKIVKNTSRFRKIEIPYLKGSNLRLVKLGWKPKYDIRQTLLDTLNYWRNFYKNNKTYAK